MTPQNMFEADKGESLPLETPLPKLVFLPNPQPAFAVKAALVTLQRSGILVFNKHAMNLLREYVERWELEVFVTSARHNERESTTYLYLDLAYSSWEELYLFPTANRITGFKTKLSQIWAAVDDGTDGLRKSRVGHLGVQRVMPEIPGLPDFVLNRIAWSMVAGKRYFVLTRHSQSKRRQKK